MLQNSEILSQFIHVQGERSLLLQTSEDGEQGEDIAIMRNSGKKKIENESDAWSFMKHSSFAIILFSIQTVVTQDELPEISLS